MEATGSRSEDDPCKSQGSPRKKFEPDGKWELYSVEFYARRAMGRLC